MTRAEEILSDISDRDCNHFFCQMGCENKLSPKKLASYLAILESSKDEDKDEDLTFEAPLTAQMVDEVLKIYPFKGEEKAQTTRNEELMYRAEDTARFENKFTPPSEEKKCGTDGKTMWCYCGKCEAESYPLPTDFLKIQSITQVSPTQEEKKLDYMMSPGNMKQVEAEYKCKCNGPIRCFEHLIFPASPTPPDAWDKLTDYINEQLQESHNEGTYKHDWLYEDILEKIEELRANS